MQSSPLSSVGKTLSLFISGNDALALHPGEIVKAEVVGVGPDNSASIKVNNRVYTVQTEVSVQKGDVLSLRVERQENVVYLRLAGNAAEQAGPVKGALLSTLSGSEKLEPAVEGMALLVNLLSALPGPLKANLPEIDIIDRFLLQIEHLSANTMKDAVENGGVFFETKLRILALGLEDDGAAADIEAGRIIANDLKASLLRLKDTFLDPAILEHLRSKVSPDELLGALNTVLRNIEFYQLQSKLTDSLQFFLPLVWRQLKDGEIIVREYDRGEPGELSYACTVNLDLERAGKVRVDLLFQGGYVHVSCAAENGDFSRLLQNGAGMLEQQFRASGLRLGNLAVLHQPALNFSGGHAAGLSIHV